VAQKKVRVPIPQDPADELLFRSDRTCCVCRVSGRPVQIHHINDDPSDNCPENLAVLCVVCHDQTQITGGFGRKLNAGQVTKYRDDWVALVEARRTGKPVNFKPIKDDPESRHASISTPETSRKSAAHDPSDSTHLPDPSGSTKSTAGQLTLFTAELVRQTERYAQINIITDALTGITHEYNGAMRRATLKARLAKNESETSRANEELADELIRIVTDYSLQAYAFRRIDIDVNKGFKNLIRMVSAIPREQRNTPRFLRWIQSSERWINARLGSIDSGQNLYNSVDPLKGRSPRLDSILEHMQEAQLQTLANRDRYLTYLKELQALKSVQDEKRVSRKAYIGWRGRPEWGTVRNYTQSALSNGRFDISFLFIPDDGSEPTPISINVSDPVPELEEFARGIFTAASKHFNIRVNADTMKKAESQFESINKMNAEKRKRLFLDTSDIYEDCGWAWTPDYTIIKAAPGLIDRRTFSAQSS
jgi:hypothetical protein